jgi:hypothetical protein
MSEVDPNLLTETEEVKPETEIKPEEKVESAPAVDYEKKFAESTRENQLLQEKLKAQEAARQELTKEPTDSDLKAAFPSWELMDDTQKELARRTYAAERTAQSTRQIVEGQQLEREWNTNIELVVSSDPALQGKEQDFRQYASKPQYRNIPMDVLVASFLQKQGGAPPAPRTTPKPGLETGNGGPRTPEKPKQLSADDLALLRKTDEKAYMDYVKTHDIKVDELD